MNKRINDGMLFVWVEGSELEREIIYKFKKMS